MQKVEDIREAYGHPITVVSGKRCEKHNVEVGGAKKSAHIEGIACDLERTPELLTFITANLEKFDLNMEDPHVTTQWIHIDLRHRPTRIFKP